MDKNGERVTPSCGCIFCDLGLFAINGYHKDPNGEQILCELAKSFMDDPNSPHPKADQR